MSGRALQAAQEPISRQDVDAALTRVLARPEFDHEPSLLEQAISWLFDRLVPRGNAGMALDVAKYVVLTLALLLTGLLLFALVRWLVRRRRLGVDAGADDGRAEIHARSDRLRARARAASATEDHTLAVRYLISALVIGLGQRGDLNYRDAWTNRELLERGRPSGEMRALLRGVVEDFEPKEFGREPASAGDVARLEQLCRRWLGRPPGTESRR